MRANKTLYITSIIITIILLQVSFFETKQSIRIRTTLFEHQQENFITLLWTVRLGEIWGTPLICDYNSDGEYEIIVPSITGLHIISSSGELIGTITFEELPPPFGDALAYDVDNDGIKEIIIGSHARDTTVMINLYIIDPENKTFEKIIPLEYARCINPGLSIGDINNDGKIEIIFCVAKYWEENTGTMYVIDPQTGRIHWFYIFDNLPGLGPALYDVDNDEKFEIFVSDGDVWTYEGNVFCFDDDGSLLWTTSLDDDVRPYLILADLNNDNISEVIATDWWGYHVRALDSRTGEILWTFTAEGYVRNTPAVADLDNDGTKDVIFISGDGYVYAINGYDGTLKWKRYIGVKNPARTLAPVVADLDGDKLLEIIVGNGENRMVCILLNNGTIRAVIPFNDSIIWTPQVFDIDNDNHFELIIAVNDTVYAFRILANKGEIIWENPRVNEFGRRCDKIRAETQLQPPTSQQLLPEIRITDLTPVLLYILVLIIMIEIILVLFVVKETRHKQNEVYWGRIKS